MKKIIEVEHLSKNFGHLEAIKDISFYVEKGSLFSFLGTNGAGKSTTIAVILTLLKPTSGLVKVNGFVVGKEDLDIKREIGVVFQESLLDPLLTVKENLMIRGSFYGLTKTQLNSNIQKISGLTDCTDFLNRRYGKLSGGQKRRADIARALVHQPNILILDEPTTGLDPQSRKNIWEMILQLQRTTQMTIFLTTHYIEEAANSDYVVVIKKGQIIAKGTPEHLKNNYSSHQLTLETNNKENLRNALLIEEVSFTEEKSNFQIQLKQTLDAIPILDKLSDNITSFEVRKSSLDDVFITINKEVEKNDVRIR